jgi:hypothetical protein
VSHGVGAQTRAALKKALTPWTLIRNPLQDRVRPQRPRYNKYTLPRAPNPALPLFPFFNGGTPSHSIASVNMCRRNAVTHALLNSNKRTNLFLIQKPWFDTIGTARKDTARQGIDVLGGVASPEWEVIYPSIPEGQ